jgi:hypothetical protein
MVFSEHSSSAVYMLLYTRLDVVETAKVQKAEPSEECMTWIQSQKDSFELAKATFKKRFVSLFSIIRVFKLSRRELEIKDVFDKERANRLEIVSRWSVPHGSEVLIAILLFL